MPAFLKWKSGEREAGQLDHNPNFFAFFYFIDRFFISGRFQRLSDPAMLTQGSPRVRYCYDTERRVSMHEIWTSIFGNKLKYGRTLHCSAENLLVFNSGLGVCACGPARAMSLQ